MKSNHLKTFMRPTAISQRPEVKRGDVVSSQEIAVPWEETGISCPRNEKRM